MPDALAALLRPDDNDKREKPQPGRTVRCQSCGTRVPIDDEEVRQRHARGRCTLTAQLDAAHEQVREEVAVTHAALAAPVVGSDLGHVRDMPF
ncbi:hypothetical protein [Mobilicoccus pelagius]|uniref:Uncharacterized protein n=1 Tax=Mobilicoccus pelagius NBRC 104925 TaxID=1089455 RepID=H5UN98_9MICO|nr:hypothetical protein [Mobilicoccus pelagius]GAB47206.1 hypothetical protein MOPEL_007_00230 [Mobilicoccus pelagius NBRC 104925]